MHDPIRQSCLTRFLRNPDSEAPSFSPEEWLLLIRQSRRTNLLSRIAYLIKQKNLMGSIPDRLREHLTSAELLASTNLRSVKWEVIKIHKALSEAKIPFALLKGAAYVMGQSEASHGRLFGDVDILVRKEHLKEAEKALIKHGWFGTKIDPYDQKYYRTWMHELPPLKNLKRQTDLDVHHTILPPTATIKPDIYKIWQASEAVPGYPGMFVLSPIDMILHSATHLFHEGNFDQGLRDIVDLDALLRESSQKIPNFWPELIARAELLELSRPLYYGLRYCKLLLGTPIELEDYELRSSEIAPPVITRLVMDKLLLKAMTPNYIGNKPRLLGLAQFILFVRSHYLRMPLRLLIPHLLRKAIKPET